MEDADSSTPKEEDKRGTKPEKPQQKTKAQKKHEENNWTRPGELPRGYNSCKLRVCNSNPNKFLGNFLCKFNKPFSTEIVLPIKFLS